MIPTAPSLPEGVASTLKGYGRTLWLGYVVEPLLAYTRWRASRSDRTVYFAYVDPNEIAYTKLFAPDQLPVTGEEAVCGSVGGPWDRLKYPFRNHYVPRTLQARFVEGVAWEETPIAEQAEYRDRPEKFERRCAKIERLVESIERNGYRLQSEIDPDGRSMKKRRIGSVEFSDEVTVGMDRRGRLIHLRGGRHRLAAAQLLDVEEIPVILTVYHPRASDAIPSDAERIGVE